MKILSQREYERRIEKAKEQAYNRAKHEAYEERERENFQRNVWNELREQRRMIEEGISKLHNDTRATLDDLRGMIEVVAGEVGLEFTDDEDPCTDCSACPVNDDGTVKTSPF